MKDVSHIKTFKRMPCLKRWIILILIFSMFGCTQDAHKVTLIVPMGSPTLSVLGLNEEDYLIDIVHGPDPLVAAFGSESHDVIIAPTNLGAKMYQSSDTYRWLAIIGLGNYHVVSTSFISDSIDQLQGKDIIVFGQHQTSDIIIRHILEATGVNSSIIYVDSLASAVATCLLDPTQIVLVAEPSLSLIKEQVPAIVSIDLNDLYQSLHEGLSFPQASIFVRKDLSNTIVYHLLSDMRESINFLINHPSVAAAKGVQWGILSDADVLVRAIPGSHVQMVEDFQTNEMIALYFDIILALNPALIGGVLPDEDFYWE